MYPNKKYILYKRRMVLITVIEELCEVLTGYTYAVSIQST